jgi:hypothetical protein
MKCGYEVPGIILLQSYLCTYSLLRGVTFEALSLSNYALSPTMLSMFETCLELLLWNISQCHCPIFGYFQYPEIFIPLKQTLLLETAKPGEKGGSSNSEIEFLTA